MSLTKKQADMTTGPISKLIITFAIPLLLGNIFQQLYNMVDTWVVGNYVSNEAFSAVGTVGPILNMLIGFFMGLSSGAGVVIAQFYGAKHYDRVHDAVHTSVVMTAVMSLLMTVFGILLIPGMLNIMNVPSEVYGDASKYLRIYFAGVTGLLFYNMGASILQAVGDSRRPFYYLAISAILNIIGDMVFVIVFKMGVDGVAYATIISQFVSAVLILATLIKTDTAVRLIPKDLTHFSIDILLKIIRVGIPAALQMMIVGFSNIFVQGYINQFGADCMSGWTAYSKIDALMFLPMQSIALSVSTFVGQNIGIGNAGRAKTGVRTGTRLALLSTVIFTIPTVLFAPDMVSFFNGKAEVIRFGTMFLRYITPCYIISCANQILAGALRGAGNAKAPMIIMISSFVIFRQIYLFFMTRFILNTPLSVGMSYPVGWLICTIILQTYYSKVDLSKTAVIN